MFLGKRIRTIRSDGSLSEEKIVSFNDHPSTWELVKTRFSELTGGRELVLSQ